MIIGLTGKTGSGKSTVAETLRSMGFFVCDADAVARQAVEKGSPLLEKIAKAFGSDVINPDGSLNRPKLAERAFADRESTDKLNALTHPEILERSFFEMRKALDKGYAAAFYDAAVLFESGADKLCDFNVLVEAPKDIRLERITKRDHLTKEHALERMNAQRADSYYRERADYIIDNSPGKDLGDQIEKLVRLLKL